MRRIYRNLQLFLLNFEFDLLVCCVNEFFQLFLFLLAFSILDKHRLLRWLKDALQLMLLFAMLHLPSDLSNPLFHVAEVWQSWDDINLNYFCGYDDWRWALNLPILKVVGLDRLQQLYLLKSK